MVAMDTCNQEEINQIECRYREWPNLRAVSMGESRGSVGFFC